ncbi:hypothetical protein A1356_09295 [Methylomonas koyamae]|uniref:Uncharacterized protein n=1 Tax=Methylomonas koyamae TaxID=702114 RepID=A0AA91I5V0_9GAMM|nr:hypothetical protein A1356_09295 [Methylomonas koyamae]
MSLSGTIRCRRPLLKYVKSPKPISGFAAIENKGVFLQALIDGDLISNWVISPVFGHRFLPVAAAADSGRNRRPSIQYPCQHLVCLSLTHCRCALQPLGGGSRAVFRALCPDCMQLAHNLQFRPQ